MVFQAKAKDVLTGDWRIGYYAEVNDKSSPTGSYHVIYENGNPYIISFNTVKFFTGVYTGKAQPIFEGDKVEVFDDESGSVTGYVHYVPAFAGFSVKDEIDGEWYDLVGSDRYFIE